MKTVSGKGKVFETLENAVKTGELGTDNLLLMAVLDEEHDWKGSYAVVGKFNRLITANKREGVCVSPSVSYSATHKIVYPSNGAREFYIYSSNEYFITTSAKEFERFAREKFEKTEKLEEFFKEWYKISPELAEAIIR